ncbi:Dynein-like protein [Giardia muris]|uniref:Dynein-like protein n=1 Tax=Giardia muris TaxID=5742 RepID=A0A4Z1ST48_GIAMU|nr:Dynein-like protein [Giardia muris]|eukprot:TNJ29106.1 Dynein-like protein [Giardia muris]
MQKAKKFQVDVEEPWLLKDELAFPGLVVLETFVHWCGYCKSIESIFRTYSIDLATRKLKFVRVQSDLVPWLRSYHGRCRPAFFFFVGGQLKGRVEGLNTPQLDTMIPSLAPEEDVEVTPFDPEAVFPELRQDSVYSEYAEELARLQEKEVIWKASIEAGMETDFDPRQEYNGLVKKYSERFREPLNIGQFARGMPMEPPSPKPGSDQGASSKPVSPTGSVQRSPEQEQVEDEKGEEAGNEDEVEHDPQPTETVGTEGEADGEKSPKETSDKPDLQEETNARAEPEAEPDTSGFLQYADEANAAEQEDTPCTDHSGEPDGVRMDDTIDGQASPVDLDHNEESQEQEEEPAEEADLAAQPATLEATDAVPVGEASEGSETRLPTAQAPRDEESEGDLVM